MKRAFMLAGGFLCALVACVQPVSAAPFDSRIPADAVVYAGWAGADSLAGKYEASNLKTILDNTKIPDYIKDNWAGWLEKAKLPDTDEAKRNMDDGMLAANLVWKHPAALYIGPVGLNDIQKPSFKFAFLCDAGVDAPALTDLLKRALAKNPPPPEAKMNLGADGTVVILTFGDITPADLAAGKQNAPLSAAPGYTAAMSSLPKEPAVAMFVDVEQIISTIGTAVEKAPDAPAEAKKNVPIMLQALGLTSITQFSYAGGFDKKDWAEAAFVGIRGKRAGILTLLDSPPISDGALAMVPKDAVSMTIGRVDLPKIWAVARDIIGQADAKALTEIDKGIANANKDLGIDFEKNIVNALGDEWIGYRGPPGDDNSHPFVVLQKLRDADAFSKTLDIVEQKINEAAQGKVKVEKIDTGKFQASGIRIPAMMAGMPGGIAWTIRNGVFYLSTIDGIGPAVDQVEQKGEAITENPGYKAVRAALPQVKPTSITYAEPAKLYPELYRTLMGLLPMARLVGLDLPADLLPNPKKIGPAMPPGGSISWSDAEGFHFAARSAFPGAQLLSGQASPPAAFGATAMGTAVLVPSLGQARENAKLTVDMANMRGIGQCCNLFAAEHDGALPDHLARLEMEFANAHTEKMLVSPRAGTEPLKVTDAMLDNAKTDFEAFSKEVDTHCDFVYLGHGLKVAQAPPNAVLLYEKPGSYTARGIPVLFYDCHVEFLTWKALPQAFKVTNNFLKKQNPPMDEVDVDALLKSVPDVH